MANRSLSLGQMSQSIRRVALLFGLAAVYYVGAKLGLRFAYINSSVTTIWPPAGIALAAFVLLGYGVWPAILAGAFFANVTTTGAVFPSVGIAVGNTIEGLLAAYLVNRFARGGRVFDRVRARRGAPVAGALRRRVSVAALSPHRPALAGDDLGGVPIRSARDRDHDAHLVRDRDLADAVPRRSVFRLRPQRIVGAAPGVDRQHCGDGSRTR